MADIIRELEKEQLRTDLPKLEVGDTVRVSAASKCCAMVRFAAPSCSICAIA